MANGENLNPPWSKGQSGNPVGKTKGTKNRSTIVKRWLEARATDGGEGEVSDQLVRALIRKAADGDVSAFKELMDSAFGKITDKVENRQTVVQMGRVIEQRIDEKTGKIVETPLEFDIGSPPDTPEWSED